MKTIKPTLLSFIVVLLVLLVSTPAPVAARLPHVDLPPGDNAKVTRVVSGDTIEVTINDIGFTVGYLGIDAPNPATTTKPAQCLGAEAKAFNSRLVRNQTLRVEREVSDFDAIGRLLRWVFLPDGRLVNEEIVRAGYALAVDLSPDTKYRDRLVAAQQAAQAARRGLWRRCATAEIITPTPTGLPTFTPVPMPTTAPQPSATEGGGGSSPSAGNVCCKVCTTGKACGDSCISRSYTCHKGPGCACNGN